MLGVAITFAVARRAAGPIDWHRWRGLLRDFRDYGLPRTLSPFVEVGLFLIGPWLLRHDLVQAGYVIIALMLIRIGQTLLQPAGYVFAAVVAGIVGRKDDASLRRGMNLLLGSLLYSAAFVFAVAFPWTGLILRLWLGDGELTNAVRPHAVAMMLGLVPFAVFQGLKEVIEMVWTAPRNLFTLFASMAVLLGSHAGTSHYLPAQESVLAAYFLAFCTAGILSVYWVSAYLESAAYFGLVRGVAVILGIATLNAWIANDWGSLPLLPATGLAIAAGLVSLLLAAILLYLPRPSPFLKEAVAFLMQRRT
jgi:hypothetical protein